MHWFRQVSRPYSPAAAWWLVARRQCRQGAAQPFLLTQLHSRSILVCSMRAVTDTHRTVTASGTFLVLDRGRLGVAVSPGSVSAGVSSFCGAADRLAATSCWCPSSRRNSHRCSRANLPLFLSPIRDSSSFCQAVRVCLDHQQQLTERLATCVCPLPRVGPLADPTLRASSLTHGSWAELETPPHSQRTAGQCHTPRLVIGHCGVTIRGAQSATAGETASRQ